MLPFENQVADYVHETNHHVLYRVTPVYEGDNLVASGVIMEAASVEDEEIRFHVFVYNVQPGIWIDYATGESRESETAESEKKDEEVTYVVNTNTKNSINQTVAVSAIQSSRIEKKHQKQGKN